MEKSLFKLNCSYGKYKKIFKTGWLHTGDFGYFDEKGIIYKVDRINDLIKYKNHLVTPSEIEQILKDHPDVTDAAVIGVPHELDGQHPMAFVTKVTNSKVFKNNILFKKIVFPTCIIIFLYTLKGFRKRST